MKRRYSKGVGGEIEAEQGKKKNQHISLMQRRFYTSNPIWLSVVAESNMVIKVTGKKD